MQKSQLLNSIAQAAYNIGFGAKKHFVTYDLHRCLPKITSFTVLAIGVLQLTSMYKRMCTGDLPDVIGALLIIVGLLAFTIDITGKNIDNFNTSGKLLISKFNRLRNMYNEASSLDDSDDNGLKALSEELEKIENEAQTVSISEQAIGTHIITNTLFFGSMQVKWIEKELKLDYRDKFPFFHWEAFVLYGLALCLLYFIFHTYFRKYTLWFL